MSKDQNYINLASSQELFSSNITFIEELYQKYSKDPASVDESWADFFDENKYEIENILLDYSGPSWARRDLKVLGSQNYDISSFSKPETDKNTAKANEINITRSKTDLNLRIANLILAYQKYAHKVADLDPLDLAPEKFAPEIDPKNHGISPEDYDKIIDLKGILGLKKATISQIIDRLNRLYTSSIGAEFEYIQNSTEKSWLSDIYHEVLLSEISNEEKQKILEEIIRTNHFEQLLHKRFPGAKRFSVEGGDSSINALEKIIDYGAKNGVKKIVFGMAHRGRLNTLTGVMGKPYSEMIAEFKGKPGLPQEVTRLGDVKYHMGYSSSREIDGNKIDLSLAFNPSHLEAVNPVVAGRIRAKQKIYKDRNRSQAMGVIIHGDAAFAGQGIVAETLMMSSVEGYDTGGIMHIIVNNQIGFTANPTDSRGTLYASDLAKSIDAPILHVNGDDVEAVVKVTQIACLYRQKFKRDIVIDLICYRRYGHNEGDEPMFTQPVMYRKIKTHPRLEEIYSRQLIAEGVIDDAKYKELAKNIDSLLDSEFEKSEDFEAKEANWLKKDWSHIENGEKTQAKTAIAKEELEGLIAKTTKIPEGFNVNSKIRKQFETREKTFKSGKNIDWGLAENLAFASLIKEGFPVRITGQDSGRGTFSHRHSILHDLENGAKYSVFSELENEKADYEVFDSILSEYGVLGFEYGYSLSMPNGLTIWEAQFGDFSNGAQIMFDQFIASAEAKWLRKSGLVMLLPHGYEGQGPEHSSARLERYLQACADDNLRVCNITNPANFFHALRRQLHSKDRKPLVIMSPKSLLRHKLAVSKVEEFTDFHFKPIIEETEDLKADEKIKKLVLCSGKIYYDLHEARSAKEIDDIAIIRLEQIYPFSSQEVSAQFKKYKNAEIIWCQEEPKNMGAWKFVEELIEESANNIKHKSPRPRYIGRAASASPATGYASYHAKEQKALIEEVLG